MSNNHQLSAPSSRSALWESRAALDWLTLPLRMTQLQLFPTKNIGQGRFVCLLPGFGTGENSMYPLQFFLEKYGFNTIGWGLGVNKAGLNRKHDADQLTWNLGESIPKNGETGVPYLCDLMAKRIQEFYDNEGKQVALVGWSLGGTIAREVARDLPHIVNQVVTLGSPLIGGPKYTAAASILRHRGLDLDWIEQQVNKRNEIPLRCKASAIVSLSDGVVDASASRIPDDDVTDYIEVNVSHLGMGVNGKTQELVLEALQRD